MNTFQELKWDGTNEAAMTAFTDGRSELRAMNDAIPNVLVIHVTAPTLPAENNMVTLAPAQPTSHAMRARLGDTVMKSPAGNLYVRTPDGCLEGKTNEFLRELLREAPTGDLSYAARRAARQQAGHGVLGGPGISPAEPRLQNPMASGQPVPAAVPGDTAPRIQNPMASGQPVPATLTTPRVKNPGDLA